MPLTNSRVVAWREYGANENPPLQGRRHRTKSRGARGVNKFVEARTSMRISSACTAFSAAGVCEAELLFNYVVHSSEKQNENFDLVCRR